MELSFAPMEGITYSAYRRVHAEMFPGADRYYAPFIAPDSTGRFKAGNLRDVLPENNAGIKLVPQLLCNAAAPFLAVARELKDLGYEEVDLNVGCPSGTVVAKHKGAGMLGDPAAAGRLPRGDLCPLPAARLGQDPPRPAQRGGVSRHR